MFRRVYTMQTEEGSLYFQRTNIKPISMESRRDYRVQPNLNLLWCYFIYPFIVSFQLDKNIARLHGLCNWQVVPFIGTRHWRLPHFFLLFICLVPAWELAAEHFADEGDTRLEEDIIKGPAVTWLDPWNHSIEAGCCINRGNIRRTEVTP